MADAESEGILETPWSGGAHLRIRSTRIKLGMWLFIISDSLTFSALLISLRLCAHLHS